MTARAFYCRQKSDMIMSSSVCQDSMRMITAQGEDRKDDDGTGAGVVTKTKPKTKKPSMWRVVLLNDDYTPMEFVVYVLEKFFGLDQQSAVQVMLHVHQKGVGVCGVFSYEIAETKVTQVIDFARVNEHPLQCTMEKE